MTTTETNRSLTIDDLFVDPRSLPTPSASVLEILRRADDPDVSMSVIADLIEGDVSIAVQVLRMANSALYSPAREITTVGRALASLGLRTVKLLALTTSLRSLVPQQSDAVDVGEIRHRMVVTASVARRAAALMDPAARDEAFVAGLLTGVGSIVLATEAPDVCRVLMEGRNGWPEPSVEADLLGFTVDEVTAELVTRWGLPARFADAIRDRRTSSVDPAEIGSDGVPMCLRVATLAEPILAGRDNGSNLEAIRELLGTTSDMDSEAVDLWLIDAESAISDTAAMLQFRMPENVAYAELLAETAERLFSLQFALEDQLFHAEESAEELAKRNGELEAEAATDALTKLANRRSFDRRLAEALADPAPDLGLLMLDLDHFKAINDQHGHAVGDDVLRLVGSTLHRQIRGHDFVARFGGEEFVVLVAETSTETLFLVAERLRAAIADLTLPLADGSMLSVTTSIGGAMVPPPRGIGTPRELIEAADRQLYEAKQTGRNRTCIA